MPNLRLPRADVRLAELERLRARLELRLRGGDLPVELAQVLRRPLDGDLSRGDFLELRLEERGLRVVRLQDLPLVDARRGGDDVEEGPGDLRRHRAREEDEY